MKKMLDGMLAGLLISGSTTAGAAPSTVSATPRQTLEALFVAVTDEDRPAFDRLTTPDFRAFEGGRMLDRATFFDLIRHAHQQGRKFQWSVTDERVTMGSGVAAMNYVNRGSVGDAGSTQSTTWLEVATFRRGHAGWQIDFVESQRIAASAKAH